MNTYKKNYIGKGTQVPNMSIVKATVKMTELLKYVHEYEGEQYCTFEVARLQEPDKFGRDHTVYCTTMEDVPEEGTKKTTK
ncbi:hypothetical protein SLH46_07705 [Draconibacterium sp. IB214405]|uniref:hypothetical protein n=1 Tax=Draconibacterium sp. IB214405 TaxID=3097352 RepID=UPI002A11DDE9|nr:hypothetical protein [Draconibacterium sp. IB214405]MDX8339064.1 hypothetical protein [Draconibacterium sp. IB214405]